MKRAFDLTAATLGLLASAPLLFAGAFLVWMQDWKSPLYVAPRGARGGGVFRMVKLRSMRIGADRSGVDSTGAGDPRITSIGRLLRRYKLDELPQLWNVLLGEMSIVGPRPQVPREIELYTAVERGLLDVRPGITDIASVVFADEADILAPHPDPDLAYNQLIRPWKSRLGLLYVRHASFVLDLCVVALTLLSLVSRRRALDRVVLMLRRLDADPEMCQVARRLTPLQPTAPPGSSTVVHARA